MCQCMLSMRQGLRRASRTLVLLCKQHGAGRRCQRSAALTSKLEGAVRIFEVAGVAQAPAYCGGEPPRRVPSASPGPSGPRWEPGGPAVHPALRG